MVMRPAKAEFGDVVVEEIQPLQPVFGRGIDGNAGRNHALHASKIQRAQADDMPPADGWIGVVIGQAQLDVVDHGGFQITA